MLTNELKKGMTVILSNGWEAVIMDNKKGNIRCAKVFGIYTDIGDIYSHNIVYAVIDDKRIRIEHTPDQIKLKEMLNDFGW